MLVWVMELFEGGAAVGHVALKMGRTGSRDAPGIFRWNGCSLAARGWTRWNTLLPLRVGLVHVLNEGLTVKRRHTVASRARKAAENWFGREE